MCFSEYVVWHSPNCGCKKQFSQSVLPFWSFGVRMKTKHNFIICGLDTRIFDLFKINSLCLCVIFNTSNGSSLCNCGLHLQFSSTFQTEIRDQIELQFGHYKCELYKNIFLRGFQCIQFILNKPYIILLLSWMAPVLT